MRLCGLCFCFATSAVKGFSNKGHHSPKPAPSRTNSPQFSIWMSAFRGMIFRDPKTMRILTKFFPAILCLLASFHAAQAQWRPLGDVTAIEKLDNGVDISSGTAHVRVTALTPNVVRVRYAPQGTFPAEHSFAVLPNAFPERAKAEVQDTADTVIVNTGSLQARIFKSETRIAFLDPSGRVISEDRPHYPASFDGTAFRVYKAMPLEEHYFGLGDKMGPLDRRDLSFSLWNMDMFGYQESTDPIYKSIPFFIGMLNGSAYGIFLDNTYRSSFDFGKEFGNAYSFGSEDGELDYYFFYGPDPKKVVSDFTALVGREPLPP